MFGFRFVKATPSTYLMLYKNGKVILGGTGLSFWYYAPRASLVSIPMQSVDAPFMFEEVSHDFQTVTVQGQATYRVAEPQTLAKLMNFAVQPNGKYIGDDHERLPQRVINAVQVQLRAVLQRQSLAQLLQSSSALEQSVLQGLQRPDGLAALGLELTNLSILAIRPTPETARALEAQVREQILKEADDATYARRNAAIAQERAVRENELNTEIAVEAKNRQIREAQLDAEQAELSRRQAIEDQAMAGKTALEEKNRELTTLRATNARTEADASAYATSAAMKAIEGVEPRVLQALMVGRAEPGALIAQAFQELAANAQKIGTLSITPELLESLNQRATPAD